MSIEQHPFTSNRWIKNINNSEWDKFWHVKTNQINKISSFGFMPNKETKSIFLGSFPIWEITIGQVSDKNLEFFYGSLVNDFWRILSTIFEMRIDNIEQRINILEIHNFGITDILETIDRNPVLCNSDNCLTAINYNNILDLKKTFPSLENIFITSGGQSPVGNLNNNNKNVATWLKDSFSGHNIDGFQKNGFVKPIIIDNIKFNLIYLISPSHLSNIPISGVLKLKNNFGIENLSIIDYKIMQWAFFLKKFHFKESKINKLNNLYETVVKNEMLSKYFNR
jgi:G:T/U-mismatch repair DNA glycosylase